MRHGMLVLSRELEQEITIGDEATRFVQLTPLDIQKLKQCTDPGLQDLAERLLDERNAGPIELAIVEVRSGPKVRVGIRAPKATPVHRREVYLEILRERHERFKASMDAELVKT